MSTFAKKTTTDPTRTHYQDPHHIEGFRVVLNDDAGIPDLVLLQQAHLRVQHQAHLRAQQQQAQTVSQWIRQERQLSHQQDQRDMPYLKHQMDVLGNWNCPRHPSDALAPSGDQWACTSCGECGGRRF